MKTRPVLKPGDVCRQSKRAKKRNGPGSSRKFDTMVVLKVISGDGSDQMSLIQCSVSRLIKRTFKTKIMRRDLWFTGYNVNNKLGAAKAPAIVPDGYKLDYPSNSEVKGVNNNDGRDTCYLCGKETNVVQGFKSSYNCCITPGCKWEGN